MKRKKGVSPRLRDALLSTTMIAGVAFAGVALSANDAAAAGFALKEQSAKAQGNSFAGATAGAEDVTYMFFNPAGLTRHDESQAAVVLSYIAPSSEYVTKDGSPETGDGGVSAVLPAAYLMWSMSPELKLALGINAPFGLKTEYPLGWDGDLYAVESELKTVNLNPSLAYKVNETLSVGVGLQIQHSEALLSQDANGANILGEMEGDGWGYGVTFGLLMEPSDTTRFGLGYRSQIKTTLEGDIAVNGTTVDTVEADLTTPDQVTAGFYHDVSDTFAVMGEVAWTNWSTFDEYRIISSSGSYDSTVPQDWENVWFLAVGATWRPNENMAIRGGIGYDQSPVPDDRRTPRIPDEDRTWVSLGLSYSISPSFSIDAGYTHIFVKDPIVDLPPGYTDPALPAFQADYEATVDILVLQAKFKF